MRYHLTPIRMATINQTKQMLVRMWRNWKPSALLVRVQSEAAAMENSMVVLQKIKNRITKQLLDHILHAEKN